MYIGELAKLTGCTPKAIRLYEQLGLLTPQRRGSYRLYPAHHLRLVQMIRRAQVLANQGIEVKRLELQAQILALQDRQQQLTQLQQQINQQFAPSLSVPTNAQMPG